MTGANPRLRVLVCGGRDYDDVMRIYQVLDRLNPIAICHGGARTYIPEIGGYTGADYFAGLWAFERQVLCYEFPADWRAFGPKAGPIRNKQMLTEFDPDLVLAFPGGRGTESMMTLARAGGVRVMQVT